MYSLPNKRKPKGLASRNVLSHNLIDPVAMSGFLGMEVIPRDFVLAEDLMRGIGPGVTWRRRRFRFFVRELKDGAAVERPEALCINEIILDSHAPSTLRPAPAAEFPELVDLSEIENAYWATTFAKGALRESSGVKETRLYCNMGYYFFAAGIEEQAAIRASLTNAQASASYNDALLDGLDSLTPVLVEQPAGGFAVVRYLPAFPASRIVQASERIIAATNAGFFLNFPEEYDDGISALHQPVGGHIANGKILAPSWIQRPGVMGLEDGSIQAGLFGPENITLEIEGYGLVPLRAGHLGDEANGQVWRRFDRGELPALSDTLVLHYTGAVLVDVAESAPGQVAPCGGASVLLSGEAAQAARKAGRSGIALRMLASNGEAPHWLISAGPMLVRDNRAMNEEELFFPEHTGEFRPNGPAPTRFPYDGSKTRAPRTALGVTSAGGLKIVVVDGRRSGEHSCGVTLLGLANLMQWLGCETAINLDGGGSSVMAVEGVTMKDVLSENAPLGIVNIPSDDGGRERIVPVFLIVEKPPLT